MQRDFNGALRGEKESRKRLTPLWDKSQASSFKEVTRQHVPDVPAKYGIKCLFYG